VIAALIVVAHNLPPPSPEEMARRAFADAVREKAQVEATAAEPNESRTPSLRVNLMCQAGYRGFDAYYDVGAGTFHWNQFLGDPGFQRNKCMSAYGYSMD
jgi:hypothetical protein